MFINCLWTCFFLNFFSHNRKEQNTKTTKSLTGKLSAAFWLVAALCLPPVSLCSWGAFRSSDWTGARGAAGKHQVCTFTHLPVHVTLSFSKKPHKTRPSSRSEEAPPWAVPLVCEVQGLPRLLEVDVARWAPEGSLILQAGFEPLVPQISCSLSRYCECLSVSHVPCAFWTLWNFCPGLLSILTEIISIIITRSGRRTCVSCWEENGWVGFCFLFLLHSYFFSTSVQETG